MPTHEYSEVSVNGAKLPWHKPSVASVSVAIEFLRRFHPASLWAIASFGPNGEIGPAATFDPGGPGEIDEADRFITALQGEYNVYFAVNAVRRKLTKKAAKADVGEIHYLHVDADLRKDIDWSDPDAVEAEKARVLAKLRAYGPPPTVIVWSGGGFQAFWKLSDLIVVNGNKDMMRLVERRMEVIEDAMGADPCHNADRIMRVPGTLNVLGKTKIKAGRNPAWAEIVEFHDDRIYDLEEFEEPPEAEPKPKKQKASGAGGSHAGSHDRAEYARAKSALPSIPNDDRDVWLKIGMALKDAFGELGYGLWLDWAQSCPKYESEDSRRVWDSLKGGNTTISTLFWKARERGWKDGPESTDAGRKPAAEDARGGRRRAGRAHALCVAGARAAQMDDR
jgi:Primase C terminal 2 (PriCT-2)